MGLHHRPTSGNGGTLAPTGVSFATEAESNSFDDNTEHTAEAEVLDTVSSSDKSSSSPPRDSPANKAAVEADSDKSGSNCSSAEATARTRLETMDSTNVDSNYGYDVDHRTGEAMPGFETSAPSNTMTNEPEQPSSHLMQFARKIHKNWAYVTKKLRGGLLHGVVNTSVVAAKYPRLTILLVSVLSIALIAGGYYTNFNIRLDNDKLFTPANSEIDEYHNYLLHYNEYEGQEVPGRRRMQQEALALEKLKEERDLVSISIIDENTDGGAYNGSHSTVIYDRDMDSPTATPTPSRTKPETEDRQKGMRGKGHVFPILFHADTQNVFTIEGIHKLFDLLDFLRAQPAYKKACRGGENSFHNSYGEDTCEIKSITRFWNHNRTLFSETIKTNDELFETVDAIFYPDGGYVDLPFILAEREEDEQGRPVKGEAFFTYIYFKKYRGFSLENKLVDLRTDWSNDRSHPYIFEFITPESFQQEALRAVMGDIPLIPVVFVVMCVFTCLVFFKCHRVHSRSLLGVGAVFTICLSLVSGYGLLFMCGVPMTIMTNLLIFMVFGIGLDDTFIITGAYFRTGHEGDPVDRVKHTMESVGSSILLTTITTSAAFMLGCSSTILPIRWLCLYAFPAIMIDFVYQITFFIAILVLDEQRIQQNRMDCCVCVRVRTEEEAVPNATSEEEGTCAETPDGRANSLQKEASITLRPRTVDPDKSDHIADRFMRWFASRLLKPVVKVFVVIAFVAFTAVCVAKTTKLKQQFQFKDLLPADSYVADFASNLEYYSDRAIIVRVVFRFVDQADEEVRNQMERFVDELVENVDALNEPAPFFWVREFRTAVTADPDLKDLPFYEALDVLLKNKAVKDAVGGDIKFRDDGTIMYSECKLYVTDLDMDDVKAQIEFLQQQRKVTRRQPINEGKKFVRFFAYEALFHIFAFYEVAAGELAVTTVSSITAVCVIAFLMIPHWSAVPIIFPLISALYIEMMGVLQMFGYSINVVTYVVLVISIGLLVDFIMHILLRYYESECDTREEKVKDALGTMGSSILVGGLSTFLGVTPLILSSSEIFATICLAFLAMVSLGVIHGLVVLPVILSYCGTEKVVHHRKRLSLVQITTSLSERFHHSMDASHGRHHHD